MERIRSLIKKDGMMKRKKRRNFVDSFQLSFSFGSDNKDDNDNDDNDDDDNDDSDNNNNDSDDDNDDSDDENDDSDDDEEDNNFHFQVSTFSFIFCLNN